MLVGASAERVERRDGRFVVYVQGSGPIATDAVIAGLGIVPTSSWPARRASRSRTESRSIKSCAPAGRRSTPPGMSHAFPSAVPGKRTRVEHEDNANTMGKVAGQNMAGANQRYEHLPFFYSDLFDLGYEAVGDVDARHETVVDWKAEFREGVVYYLEGARVRGVLLWNTWEQVDAASALIAQPGPFRPGELKGRLPAT
jgi:hypothetical protein